MEGFLIQEEDFVQLPEITRRMRYCLRNQVGFSLVRVGDGENLVMAQGMIYGEEQIKKIAWAKNESYAGVTLPNYEARDRVIAGVRNADIVGVLSQDEAYDWTPLTQEIFGLCNIKPRQICYAFINTYLANYPEFIHLLRHYKVLLIGKPAITLAGLLKEKLDIQVVKTVPLNNYCGIPTCMAQISRLDYELVLISGGINAVIMAPMLASQGKVAIDFGSGWEPKYWQTKKA